MNNTEFWKAVLVLWCAVMYWLGGQEIPWTKRGYKFFRRFAMPIGLALGLIFLLGGPWYRVIPACVLLGAGCHLGYGTEIWKLPLTAAAMVSGVLVLYLPVIPPWWVGIPITYHTAYGIMSRRYPKFVWAYVAVLMGVGLGIAYTSAY